MKNRTFPEWQVELAIIDNLKILNHEKLPIEFDRIENQYYLKNKGRYIDLLLRKKKHFYIVELKGVYIDEETIITNQLLDYKEGIMKEKGTSSDNITCILASPFGFSDSVKKLAEINDILLIKLNEQKIYSLIPKGNEISNKFVLKRFLQRRLNLSDNELINDVITGTNKEYESILLELQDWFKFRKHSISSLEKIALRMKEISNKAPIMAHNINEINDFSLIDDNDKWWWLIYSVLDKRGNASSFHLVKKYLTKKNLFYPQDIIGLMEKETDTYVLELLTELISESGISTRQNIKSLARGICEAAIKLRYYNYSFTNIYTKLKRKTKNEIEFFELVWDFFLDIHGVGPRICSQIIRGLKLKGNWILKTNNPLLLEEQKHNLFIAKDCLKLIDESNNFKQGLLDFSSKYLDCNNEIISHILWYIRKRYSCTSKKPLCEHCPLSGYCNVYLNNIFKFDKLTGQIKITDFIEKR